MKIRSGNGLLLINILVILLIVAIVFVPSSVLRTVIGLPFLLFFPGYVLVLALFPRKESLEGIARLALSFGASLTVIALIGLALNYSPWRIRLEPVLYTVSAFIFITSAVAFRRARGLPEDERFHANFNLDWLRVRGSTDRLLTAVLGTVIIATVGVLFYVMATPRVGETFTEFYILGPEKKADGYPAEFIMDGNRVVLVKYGKVAKREVEGDSGRVVVGLVNKEQSKASYTVQLKIDGKAISLYLDGVSLMELGPVELAPDEKWERVIGFAPQRTGMGQKVDFVLYKDGALYYENPPHIWIDVTEKK